MPQSLEELERENTLLELEIENAQLEQEIYGMQPQEPGPQPLYQEPQIQPPDTAYPTNLTDEPVMQVPGLETPAATMGPSPDTFVDPEPMYPDIPAPQPLQMQQSQAPADLTMGQTVPETEYPYEQEDYSSKQYGLSSLEKERNIGQEIMNRGMTPRQAARRDAGTADPNKLLNFVRELVPAAFYQTEAKTKWGTLMSYWHSRKGDDFGDDRRRYGYDYLTALSEEMAKKESEGMEVPPEQLMTETVTRTGQIPDPDAYIPNERPTLEYPGPEPTQLSMERARPTITDISLEPKEPDFQPALDPMDKPPIAGYEKPEDVYKDAEPGMEKARIDAPGDQPSTEYAIPEVRENIRAEIVKVVEGLKPSKGFKEKAQVVGDAASDLLLVLPEFALTGGVMRGVAKAAIVPKYVRELPNYDKVLNAIDDMSLGTKKALTAQISAAHKMRGEAVLKNLKNLKRLSAENKATVKAWARKEKITLAVLSSYPAEVSTLVAAESMESGNFDHTAEDWANAAIMVGVFKGIRKGYGLSKNYYKSIKAKVDANAFLKTKPQWQKDAADAKWSTTQKQKPDITGSNVKPKTKTPAYPGTAAKGKEAELIGRLGTPKTPAVQTEIIKKPQKVQPPKTPEPVKGDKLEDVSTTSRVMQKTISQATEDVLKHTGGKTTYIQDDLERIEKLLKKYKTVSENDVVGITEFSATNLPNAKLVEKALVESPTETIALIRKVLETTQPPKSKVASPETEGAPAVQQEFDFEGNPVKAKPAQEIKADYNTQDFAWTKRILKQTGNKNPTDAEVLKAMEKRVPNTPRPKEGKGKQGSYDQEWKTEIIKQNRHLLKGIAEGDPEANMKAVKLKDLPDVIYLGGGTRLTRVETRGQQHFKAIQTAKEKITKLLAKNKKNKTAKRTESLKKLRAEIKDRNQKINDTSGTDTIEYRNYDYKDEIYDMKLIAGEKGKVWIDKSQDLKGGDLYVDGEMVFEPVPDFSPADEAKMAGGPSVDKLPAKYKPREYVSKNIQDETNWARKNIQDLPPKKQAELNNQITKLDKAYQVAAKKVTALEGKFEGNVTELQLKRKAATTSKLKSLIDENLKTLRKVKLAFDAKRKKHLELINEIKAERAHREMKVHKPLFLKHFRPGIDGRKGLLQKIKRPEFKNTPWAMNLYKDFAYRKYLDDLATGKNPKPILGVKVSPRVEDLLRSQGTEGIWTYLQSENAIGEAEKPGWAVPSSLLWCDPTELCAKFCYAQLGNYMFPKPRQKRALTDIAHMLDPKRLGDRIAEEWIGKGLTDTALRWFDIGDLSPQWLKVIKQFGTHKHHDGTPLRSHVFSKKPELLKHIAPYNVRLLSVDAGNLPVIKTGLPLAWNWTGATDIEVFNKIKDQVQVIFEVQNIGDVSPDMIPISQQDKICPVDAGKTPLNKGICRTCDKKNGVGCFLNQTTKKIMQSVKGTPPAPITIDQLKEKINGSELTKAQQEQVLQLLGTITKEGSTPAAKTPGNKRSNRPDIVSEQKPSIGKEYPVFKELMIEHGTTLRPTEASFIFPGGEMLDTPNGVGAHEKLMKGRTGVERLLGQGAIRLAPINGGLEMTTPLTKEQIPSVRDYILDQGGKVLIDLQTPETNIPDFARSYPEGTHYRKVVKDITDFYNGKKVQPLSKVSEAMSIVEEPKPPIGEPGENLKKFMKGSKIVNWDGTPQVMYHGTSAPIIKQFENATDYTGNPYVGAGYFTNDPDVASDYAINAGTGDGFDTPAVQPFYLSIKNPANLEDAKVFKIATQGLDYYSSQSVDDFLDGGGEIWSLLDDVDGVQIVKNLEAAGYDGATFSETGYITVVPFYANQIKSATGNKKFNPNKDSIVEEQLDLFKQKLKNIKPVPFKKLPIQTQRASLKAEAFLRRATKNRLDLEASQIMAALQKEGKADLVGIKVTDPELMAAVQILRHPLWEIAWLIFSKNGKVKMVRGVSSRTPGASSVKPEEFETMQDYLNWIEKTMKDNGYDEVRSLHNHPSGDPSPSDQDIAVTIFSFAKVKGFKGHHVIDHGKWSTIDPEGNVTHGSLDMGNVKDPWIKKSQIKLNDIPALIEYATTMNVPKKNVGIIHIGRHHKLQGVENLRLDLLKGDGQAFKDELTEAMQIMGSLTPIAALSPNNFELLAPKLMKLRVFEDILSSDGTSYRIQMENNWLRAREWRTLKGETVQEQRDLFENPEPPPEPGKVAKIVKGAKEFFKSERERTPKAALPMYDRWVKEIQVRSFELAKLVNDVRRMGTKTEREAVPFIIEKTSVPEKLNREDIEKALGNPDSNKKIMAMAAKAEKYFAESWDYMVINRPEMPVDAIQNYVTHLWDIPKKKMSDVVTWFSTRNPQLMKRMIATIQDGVDELGLTPKTLDIAEILSVHGQNAIRTTENKVLLEGLKSLSDANGMKMMMPTSKAPNDWETTNHPSLKKATWAGEGTIKKKIKLPRQTIIQTIEKIKTISRSGGTVDGDVSGPMKKLEKVVEGALQSRGMTPGESSQYLNRLKAAYAGKNVSDSGGERTTETVNRRVNTILDEIEQNVEVKYPKIIQVPLSVHPDLEPLIQAVFSTPWNLKGSTNALITAWEGSNAVLKQTSLAASFFHHIALGEAGLATMGPEVFKVMFNVNKMLKAGAKGTFDMFEDKFELAKDGITHGLMLGATLDVQKPMVDEIILNTGRTLDKLLGEGWGKPFEALGFIKEKWDQNLWDYYHNGLKLLAYEKLVSRELANATIPLKSRIKQKIGHPWTPIKADLSLLTPKQIKDIKMEIATMVNDTFGGQNLMLQMKDPQFQRALRMSFLSPDWLKSTLRQAASITSVGTFNPNAPGMRKLRTKMGLKFWLRAMIYFGGANMGLNYLLTKQDDKERNNISWKEAKGKWMWENDPGHETHVFWDRGPAGEKLYLRTGKQFREGPEFFWDSQANEWSPFTATMKKLGGKAAPVPQILSSVITGHTLSMYEVRELRKVKGWKRMAAISKYLSTTWMPFSFSALRDDYLEWSPIMFAFPVSKGMSAYKTRQYMKYAEIEKDKKFLRRIAEAAIDNDIPDVLKMYRQASREINTEASAEYKRNLKKAGIKEDELRKIKTNRELDAANSVVKKLLQQKEALAVQQKVDEILMEMDFFQEDQDYLDKEIDAEGMKEIEEMIKDLKAKGIK